MRCRRFQRHLGGPHYCGRDEVKRAVRETSARCRLQNLREFQHTGPVQYKQSGLIDHIAVSEPLAELVGAPEIWQRKRSGGETVSGVAVGLYDR